jgi:hypothetical protein
MCCIHTLFIYTTYTFVNNIEKDRLFYKISSIISCKELNMGCCQSNIPESGGNLESGEFIEEEKFLQSSERKFPITDIDIFKLIGLISRTSHQWKLNQAQLISIMNEFSIDINPYLNNTSEPLGRFLRKLESKEFYNARSISGSIVLLSSLDERSKSEAFFRIWCSSDALLRIGEIHHMVTRLSVLAVEKLPVLSMNNEESPMYTKLSAYLKTLNEAKEAWVNSVTANLVRYDAEKELTIGQFAEAITTDFENKSIVWPGTIRRAILKQSFTEKGNLK